MRLLDVLLAFPALLLAMVLLATAGPSDLNLILVITVVYIPLFARIARSMVLDLRTREFVEAARLRGETRAYLLFREMLPNAIPPLVVEASVRFAYSIFLVASLGFLGLGVPPPSPDWGLQVNEARTFVDIAPWMMIAPGGGHRPAGDRHQPHGRRSALRVQPSRIEWEPVMPPRESSATARRPRRPAAGRAAATPAYGRDGADARDRPPLRLLPHRGGRVARRPRRDAGHPAGEAVGLVGESGSGKTTFALGAIGYLPGNGRVEGGASRLHGVDLVDSPPQGDARAVGLEDRPGQPGSSGRPQPHPHHRPPTRRDGDPAPGAEESRRPGRPHWPCSTGSTCPTPAPWSSATPISCPAACCSAAPSPWRC